MYIFSNFSEYKIYTVYIKLKALFKASFPLRRGGSNSRPSGYEPDELPLLYFAMWGANIRAGGLPAKQFLILYLRTFRILIATKDTKEHGKIRTTIPCISAFSWHFFSY